MAWPGMVSQNTGLSPLRDRPLSNLQCANAECKSHECQRGQGLRIQYWRGGGTIRYLRCDDCGAGFSERKGTPLFNLRISEEKAYEILEHLAEGCGVRRTARLCKVKTRTVSRLLERCGQHFRLWHDKFVKGLSVYEAQMDEKWSFVGKKQKHCDADNSSDEGKGDQWDHVILAAESRLVVSMVPGKRTGEQTSKLVKDFAGRTDGMPALFTSDEHKPYSTALLEQYGEMICPAPTGNRGRPRNPFHAPSPDLVYATVCKKREKGRIIEVRQTLIYGNEEQLQAALDGSQVSATINTSFVERYNGTDRTFNSRKARCTYGFSKEIEQHEAASWFGVTSYNFCRPHGGLRLTRNDGRKQRRTPAMAAGLAGRPLDLSDIVGTQLFPGIDPEIRI